MNHVVRWITYIRHLFKANDWIQLAVTCCLWSLQLPHIMQLMQRSNVILSNRHQAGSSISPLSEKYGFTSGDGFGGKRWVMIPDHCVIQSIVFWTAGFFLGHAWDPTTVPHRCFPTNNFLSQYVTVAGRPPGPRITFHCFRFSDCCFSSRLSKWFQRTILQMNDLTTNQWHG